MKLDRNTNPDGRGRYALIQMREVLYERGTLQQKDDLAAKGMVVCIPAKAIRLGNEGPGEQFFVLKYKDKFAAAALWAYADAVNKHASQLSLEGKHEESKEFTEFAQQIKEEAEKAEAVATKTPAPLKP